MKKYIAEMIGTMVLVLMGCGSAVFAGSVTGTVGAGVGTVGVALAFGLSVVAMAYAIATTERPNAKATPLSEVFQDVTLILLLH